MISPLQYITQESNGLSHLEHIERLCTKGLKWVQLRVKEQSEDLVLELAEEAKRICDQYHTRLIINDYPAIAKAVGADGVHLGKTDMPPTFARRLLGKNVMIGGTANTLEDIRRLVASEVDYIGLGPFRSTNTKKNLSPILGLEGFKSILEKCEQEHIRIPIIAIGGIVPEDIGPLRKVGVFGVAISSYLNKHPEHLDRIWKELNKRKETI